MEYMRRATQCELNDRDDIVSKRDLEKSQLRDWRGLRANPPDAAEIDTAIAHVNGNGNVQAWVSEWLPGA